MGERAIDALQAMELSSNQNGLVLVDPENLCRQILKLFLESECGFSVVAEANTVPEALECLDKFNPSYLITEVVLSGTSGIELLSEINRRFPHTRCLILTRETSPAIIRRALAARALAYLRKSDSIENFRDAMQSAREGKRYIQADLIEIAGGLEEELGSSAGKSQWDGDPLSALSPREKEIFYFLANGLQNSTIAKKLFISPRTVETHRARVVRKLSLHSNAELIRFAIRQKLTSA